MHVFLLVTNKTPRVCVRVCVCVCVRARVCACRMLGYLMSVLRWKGTAWSYQYTLIEQSAETFAVITTLQ